MISLALFQNIGILEKNIRMRFCLIHAFLFCFGALAMRAADLQEATRIRSVVRTDARSGKLVRSVTVTPVSVTPKPVAAREADSKPKDSPIVDLPISELVEATARKYGVDPLLVHAVIQVESSYNPFAVSPKGAQGLMQLMPGTAQRFGVQNVFKMADNVEGGVKYLRFLQDMFQDDRLTIAAYNAGEAAVVKYNWSIPPYPETQNYVYQVGKRLGQARQWQKKQQTQKAAKTQTATVETAQLQTAKPEETHRPVESFVDDEGKLHMRMR
jgi:soluble lytic murein transglycosylase-like protein